jgi:hypothetical protein
MVALSLQYACSLQRHPLVRRPAVLPVRRLRPLVFAAAATEGQDKLVALKIAGSLV